MWLLFYSTVSLSHTHIRQSSLISVMYNIHLSLRDLFFNQDYSNWGNLVRQEFMLLSRGHSGSGVFRNYVSRSSGS